MQYICTFLHIYTSSLPIPQHKYNKADYTLSGERRTQSTEPNEEIDYRNKRSSR